MEPRRGYPFASFNVGSYKERAVVNPNIQHLIVYYNNGTIGGVKTFF